MALRLNLKPVFDRHPHAREVLKRLGARGWEAVIVGGAVREVVRHTLGLIASAEVAEVDIATQATPEEVLETFPAWPAKVVGQAFGVVVLEAPDGQRYEVASYRREADHDGRWPGRISHVRSLRQDVQRRDFTVNGLAAHANGALFDAVGGVRDLQDRCIRAIGNPERRFVEDHLRMLRAVRFACGLGAEIEPHTAAAITRLADTMLTLSRERVRDELLGILTTPAAARGVKLLDAVGLLRHVLPEVCALQGVPQPPQYHPEGDVYIHTLLALDWADRLRLPPLTKLCVLLHDVGKPAALVANAGAHMGGHDALGRQMAGDVCRRLRFSRSQTAWVCGAVGEHMRVAQWPQMTPAKRRRFLADVGPGSCFPPPLEHLFGLLLCDAQASAHRASAWLPVLQQLARDVVALWMLKRRQAARKLLDGHDVLALGVAPGPQVGRVLDAVYDRIYAGEVVTRAAALRAARDVIVGGSG